MALKFKDIKDWKPSTISIVDQPSHPMAVFEVYENDEEFVKKYIPPEEVEVMTKEDNGKNNVQVSEGILEKYSEWFKIDPNCISVDSSFFILDHHFNFENSINCKVTDVIYYEKGG